MNLSTPIPNWELSARFSVDQLHLENFLDEELKKLYRPSRAMAYFKAYEKFGMIERYGYSITSGLAFMAIVFEIAGEINPVSSGITSPYFVMCMDVARKVSTDLLKSMSEDASQTTPLIMLFIALAYINQPRLH